MTLLFPLGLAALASMLLPLLIHLARRTEQRPTDFAALRWLRQKPRPRHRPRFDERLLLAMRLLLLAVIAVILAQPVSTGDRAADAVVAVVPGADVPAATGARRVWLAPGFPPIDVPRPIGPVPVGSLIRQLDAELPPAAPWTVIVPRNLDGADAERPRVSRAVTWRVAGEGRAPAPPIRAAQPALRYDPAVAGARYVVAAVRALGGTDIGGVAQPIVPRDAARRSEAGATDGGRGALIWLASGALPSRITAYAEAGHIVLVSSSTVTPAGTVTPVWRDAAGATLVEGQPLGRGRILRLTRALTPAAMPALLEPDFPRRLAALFASSPAPTRVVAGAYAPQPGASAPPPPARPLWPWIGVAVAALFLIERWLATRSARAVAP